MKNNFSALPALFRAEQASWWKSRRGCFHMAVWTLVVCGMTAFALFLVPTLTLSNPAQDSARFLFGSMASILAGAIIIISQGTIVAEERRGVTEWILSKPVSRSEYILAKLISGGVQIFLVLLALPYLTSALLLMVTGYGNSTAGELAAYLKALGILYLFVLFHLSIALVLGSLLRKEGAVGGSGIGILIAGTVLIEIVPALKAVSPWVLPNLAPAVALAEELPQDIALPLVVTAAGTMLLSAGAVLIYRKKEMRRDL